MKKLFIILFLLILPFNASAKDNKIIITCDKEEFKESEEFACRISANGSFAYNKITFTIETTNGLFIEDIRTNFTTLWDVEHEGNKVTASLKRDELINNLQEFGIILFSTTEFGDQEIKLKNVILENTIDDETSEIKEISQKIKIVSSENRLKQIKINGESLPKFNSNTYIYEVEYSNNQTEFNIDAVALDENSIINGIGEIKINPKEKITFIPIKVTSESMVNKIYLIKLINKDLHDQEIKASSILLKDNKGTEIDLKFNPNLYEYNLELDSKITSIDIKVEMDSSELKLLKDYGNRSVTIESGDNTFLIKILDEEENIKTYVISITQLLQNKSANCYLKSLSIKNIDLQFNKRVKKYNVEIKKSLKKLDINAITEDDNASVSILGNEDLKEGSVVRLQVKAANESKLTYELNISYKKTNFITPIVLLIILFFIIKYINNNKKKIQVFISNIKKNFNDLIKKKKVTTKKTIAKKKGPTKKKPPIKKEKSTSKKEKNTSSAKKDKTPIKKKSNSTAPKKISSTKKKAQKKKRPAKKNAVNKKRKKK